ncbi:MAG: class I SAM-dependent methyltransferase [Chitinophagaceae bacterium]|nr:class I SAM-dependent methyltransferase [Chitinophagaceae bacterium]
MKGRYHETDKILDQGCGTGRNMHWFLQNGIEIYGIDKSEELIAGIKLANPTLSPDRFKVSLIEKMPFPDNYFDHVYKIPDGSTRFLLTRPLLTSSMLQNNLSFLEPLKTVNVDDIRCMSTLVLQKN